MTGDLRIDDLSKAEVAIGVAYAGAIVATILAGLGL